MTHQIVVRAADHSDTAEPATYSVEIDTVDGGLLTLKLGAASLRSLRDQVLECGEPDQVILADQVRITALTQIENLLLGERITIRTINEAEGDGWSIKKAPNVLFDDVIGLTGPSARVGCPPDYFLFALPMRIFLDTGSYRKDIVCRLIARRVNGVVTETQ